MQRMLKSNIVFLLSATIVFVIGIWGFIYPLEMKQ